VQDPSVDFVTICLRSKSTTAVERFVVMLTTLHPEVAVDREGLKFHRGFRNDNISQQRLGAVACGPIVGHGVYWDPKNYYSVLAGINKNHADQVDDSELSHDLEDLSSAYAEAEVNGHYDALSKPHKTPLHLLSEDEVISSVAEKSPAKARRYLAGFIDYISGGYPTGRARCKLKVKPEILKLGKSPRVIHDFDVGETVMAHSWAILLEWFIKTTSCWKGLKTALKYLPFKVAVDHFDGDCYGVCLDDEARDSNTKKINFLTLTMLLTCLGIILTPGHLFRLWRVGVSLLTLFGRVWSRHMRLLSGVSYTSSMNWVTSRFMWFCIMYWLGVSYRDYIVSADGDDNFAIIRGRVVRTLKLERYFTEARLKKFGLRLGKRLKLEKAGWVVDGTSWPAVGGESVFLNGDWCFMPSQSRSIIKAGWALNNDWDSYKAVAGRVTARSWALNDRFDGVPIWWAYARVVAAYSQHLGAAPIFDSDEDHQRSEQGWDGGLAREPTVLQREMYAVAFGVDCGNQLLCEQLLFDAMRRGDFTADLTLEFRDLLCRG